MRSCTSSSDAGGPLGSASARASVEGPWLRTFAAALALAAAALGALELHWRRQGHRPTTLDDLDLWAVQRSRVYGDAGDVVVLVGQSRLQLGFCSAVFHERFPGVRLANLAVEGHPPLATLRDLAEDEDFRGTVLCSAFPLIFERSERERQLPWVRHYHREVGVNALLNRRLASLAQGQLVVMHPELRLSRVLIDLVLRRPAPAPAFVVTAADRGKAADYSRVHIDSYRARRIARRAKAYAERAIPTPQEWAEHVADAVPWLRRIESRGGRVVFVGFPTSGEHAELDERYYPRAEYWNRLAALTGALTIHCDDDPRTAGFVCPDTSHLDCRDAPRFTAALLDVLVEHRVLPGPLSAAAAPGR